MPKVESLHPEFAKRLDQWTKCRDAVEGEDSVKAKGKTYLPELSGQTPEEYSAYKRRASFFNAGGRTVKALIGAVMRKPPDKTLPKAIEDMLPSLGPCGEDFDEITKTAIEDTLTTGRFALFVDADQAPEGNAKNLSPYITMFSAECVVNWRTEMITGEEKLTLVVLKEEYDEPTDDPFVVKCEVQYRELRLAASPSGARIYVVQLWRKNQAAAAKKDEYIPFGPEIVPTAWGGKPFDFIPFTFIGSRGVSSKVEKPPVLDLVNVNLSHYLNSADLEHGRHFTALPTAWAAGFALKSGSLDIGSARAWITDEPSAKCGFLEFTGAGLGHLSEGMKDKEKQMAVLGGRLLEEKGEAESGVAITMRQSGERSVLADISIAVSLGLSRALQYLAKWMNLPEADISVRLNTDFDTANITPEMLTALMANVQGGLISWETYFHNLKKGEVVPDPRTEEEERALIEKGPPMGLPPAKGEDKEPPKDDDE